MHLEPLAIIVGAQIGEEEEGVWMDRGRLVGRRASGARLGESDVDGFARLEVRFHALAPEFLTFLASCACWGTRTVCRWLANDFDFLDTFGFIVFGCVVVAFGLVDFA